MKKIDECRKNLNLIENWAISSQDFEKLFTKTNEKIRFTFNGWDGKSYDGESRVAIVLKTTIKGLENIKFIKVGINVHYISDDMVLDKTTGDINPVAEWFITVKNKI